MCRKRQMPRFLTEPGHMTLFHSFLKAAETIAARNIIRIILSRLRVCSAEEFYHMEAAFVNVEVNVPLFKVGRMGFPNLCFRVQCFDCLPCSKTNTLAMAIHIDEQQLKLVAVGVRMDRKYGSTHHFISRFPKPVKEIWTQ